MPEIESPGAAPVKYVAGISAEPLTGRALYVGIVTVLLSVAAHWGLKLNAEQTAVAVGLVAFLAPQVVAWWGRRHVNSPATMAKALEAQRKALTR